MHLDSHTFGEPGDIAEIDIAETYIIRLNKFLKLCRFFRYHDGAPLYDFQEKSLLESTSVPYLILII